MTYEQNAADELKVYLDGELILTSSNWGGTLDSSASSPLTLGMARPDGSSWGDFEGLLDDFAVWDVSLTPEQVQVLYEGASPMELFGFTSLIGVDVEQTLLDPGAPQNTSLYVRSQFDVLAPEQFERLDLNLRYDAGFVAYLNGVEVARDNVPADVAWNSQANGEYEDLEATVFRSFNLTDHLDLLQPGANVLAIQALNSAADDTDLLLDARLSAFDVERGDWVVSSHDEPVWHIFDGETRYDATLPTRVGDFNGDGKDDIAWLFEAPSLWQVDTEGPVDGNNPNNWQENTQDTDISLEMIYTDVDDDGEFDDLVVMIITPDNEAFMLYKPLSMAYFLKSQGMTITEEFFSAMSEEQQEQWYLDSQTPEQSSSFTKTDPNGPNTHPNVRWNMIGGNTNLDNINEVAAHASWTVLTVDDFDLPAGEADLRVMNFSGGFFGDDNGAGFNFNLSVLEAEYSYGPVTATSRSARSTASLT